MVNWADPSPGIGRIYVINRKLPLHSCTLDLAFLFLHSCSCTEHSCNEHWVLLHYCTLALLHSCACTIALVILHWALLHSCIVTAMLRWAIMSSVTLKCYSKVPSMSHWAVLQCYSTAPAVSNNVFNNVTLSSVTVLRQCSSEQCDPLIGGFHSNKIVGQALSSQPTSKLKSTNLQVEIETGLVCWAVPIISSLKSTKLQVKSEQSKRIW